MQHGLCIYFWRGLLTLITPCVVPVLPIVIAGALQSGRLGPLAMAARPILGVGCILVGTALLLEWHAISKP